MKVYVHDFTATFRFPKGTDPKKAAGCVAYNVIRLHNYLERGLCLYLITMGRPGKVCQPFAKRSSKASFENQPQNALSDRS